MRFIKAFEIEQALGNNNRLLCQIQVSDKMYQELLENAKWTLDRLFMQKLPQPNIVLSLTMVQVAMRCFKDGNYWKIFNDEVGVDISGAKQNYIGQIFLETIEKYNLFKLDQDDGNAKYVENIKAHAFVTDYYMYGFFDFLYAYYENNLFRQLPDDISEDLEALSSFMDETLRKNNDIISAGENGIRAAKTYKLLKSTRAVFARCTIENLQTIINPILVMIDRYFYEGEVSEIATDRYEKTFADWLEKRASGKGEAGKNGGIERTFYNPKPYIRVEGVSEPPFLIIPKQKFRPEDCDGKVFVEITTNGYTECRELELYKSFGIFISEQIKFPILDIFARMDITIAQRPYKIAESPYRIFDKKWNNIGKFVKGHNYLLTKKTSKATWENCNMIDTYDGYESWNGFSVIIEEDSICYVDKHPLSLLGEFSVEPVFDSIIEEYTITRRNKDVLASTSHPTISFFVSEVKMRGTFLRVNGRKYMLSDIREKTCCISPKDRTEIAVTVALEDVLGYTQGYFIIELDVPGEKSKLLCEYLVLKKFHCKFHKSRYVYDGYAELKVTHNGIELKNIPSNWVQLDYVKNVSTTYNIPLLSEIGEAKFDFYMDEVFTLSMPFKVFMYGFSLLEMKIDKPKYIWYGDLKETLYVKIPGAVSAGVYLGKNKKYVLKGEELETRTGLFRINISEFVRNIKDNYKEKYQYISVEGNIPLPPILRNLTVDPFFELEYSKKEGVYTTILINGKAKLYLTVKDYQTDNIVIEHRECVSGKNIFPELTRKGYYDFYPIMEEADEFGLDIIVTPLKIKRGVGVVDINNLSNCRLVVKMLVCDGGVLPLEYEYSINLTEKETKNTYVGYMNAMKRDGKVLDKNTLKKFGRIHIKLDRIDEEMKVTVQLWSYREEMWMDPYYDVERNMIISCDDSLLDTVQDVSRFILLDSETTKFIFDRKKLRRTR